jgi:hypothetical protein
MELFEQHDVDGYTPSDVIFLFFWFFLIMEKILEIESEIEFVADINDRKDCLMSQDPTQDNPGALWFNIDIPKGHSLKAGDRIRITIEKV